MSDIAPALTPDQWESLSIPFAGNPYIGYADHLVKSAGVVASHDAHAIAALVLYGEPFGFTHADVEKIDTVREEMPVLTGELAEWFDSIRARIAALLPPGKG